MGSVRPACSSELHGLDSGSEGDNEDDEDEVVEVE